MDWNDPTQVREYQKQYRLVNKDKLKMKARQSYLANHEAMLQKQLAYRIPRRKELSDKQRIYASEHLEERSIYNKVYYQTHPEKFSEYRKRWKETHSPEEISAYNKIYFIINRIKLATQQKLYNKTHPEVIKAARKRRRARIKNAPINDFTAKQWLEMQIAYNHQCVYCGKRAKGHLTQDHITPLSKGGSHTKHNIVPACATCNKKKFTGLPLIPIQPLLL